MGNTFAYLRASTDKQDIQNQRYEILEYANQNDLKVGDWVEVTISSRKTTKQRRIDELMERLEGSDTLIVTELSRLGRSTAEIIDLVNQLIQQKIRLIVIKQNLDLKQHDMASKILTTIFSLLAELERDLISVRTREALAAKKAHGLTLGKPKGTIQASKFDKHRESIEELLKLGVSVRKIAKVHLGLNSHYGLNQYVKRRGLLKQSAQVEVKK
ncbi:MAG: recombinase family protein [Caldilineaceae bacterium]|nr:recombinase family protein [Caldilineaceae bacterium]MCB0094318.1 recombinase family protein [Caldilineaceae bacterium]